MSGDKTSEEFVALMAAAEEEVAALGDDASDSAKMLAQIGREGVISADMVGQAMAIETSEGGRFYQGMLKASETMSGMISTLKDDAMNLVGNVFAPLSASFAENVLPLASGYLQSLAEAFEQGGTEGLIDELGNVLGDVLTRASKALPNMLKVATNIVSSIAKAIVKNAPKIIAGLASSATTLFDSAVDLLPGLLSSIADALPSLVPILAGGLSDLVYSLASNADDFLAAGGKLAMSLIEGIVNSLPILGAGLMDALTALFTNTDEIAEESARLVDEYFGATIDAYDAFKQSIAAADKKYEDAVADIELKEQTAKNLLDYYDQLNALENPTEEDLTNMANVAAQVAELYPELQQYIDPITGSFTANTEAIRANIDALSEQAMIAAKQQLLTDRYKLLAEGQISLQNAQENLDKLIAQREALEGQLEAIKNLELIFAEGSIEENAQAVYDALSLLDPDNLSGFKEFFTVVDGVASLNMDAVLSSSVPFGASVLEFLQSMASIKTDDLAATNSAIESGITLVDNLTTTVGNLSEKIEQTKDWGSSGEDEAPLTRFVKDDINEASEAYDGAPESLSQKANRAKMLLKAKLAAQKAAQGAIGGITSAAIDASDESGEYTAYGEEVAGYVAHGLELGSIGLADAGREAMLTFAKALEAEKSSVEAAGRAAGQAVGASTAEGVKSSMSGVSSAVSEGLSSAAAQAESKAKEFRDVGYQISAGMAQGVRNGSGVLVNAVTAVIDEALNAARRKAQISSPSRLFANEVGVYIPAGVAMGVEDSSYLLNNSIRSMIDNSLPDMANYGGGLGSWQRVQQLTGGGNEINQTINFNQPVQTPDEVAQAMYEIATFPMAGEVMP